MKYELRIVRAAEKEMDKLPNEIRARLSKRILSLEDNPRPRGSKKLSGREEFRLRVGNYRILYTIDDYGHVILVLAVGHRREIY